MHINLALITALCYVFLALIWLIIGAKLKLLPPFDGQNILQKYVTANFNYDNENLNV